MLDIKSASTSRALPCCLALLLALVGAKGQAMEYQPHQTDVFNRGEGQAVAWADFDLDGDADLVVGFRRESIALYRNQGGTFVDVAGELGLSQDKVDTRSLAWGDFNSDGWPDLYVGFGRDSNRRNQLYENRGGKFVEVAEKVGVDVMGTSRQASWIDYDNDGDIDLFVAMRDRTSKMLRNDGGKFTDVSRQIGLSDPRRSVGAAWFDFDQDGDLDLFLANQSGDTDGFYRNDDGQFHDIAPLVGVSRLPGPEGRSLQEGSVGASVCDINADGFMDLFVPSYGPDVLYLNDGEKFVEQGHGWGVRRSELAVSSDCGDLNNDGLSDLYLAAYKRGETHGQDAFYWNTGTHFTSDFPRALEKFDGDHGVRFADFDQDGFLDIALTNRAAGGVVSLLRSQGGEGRSIFVQVLGAGGLWNRQGAEVRVYQPDSNELIGSGVVDTGGGYVSQNMLPVHVGVGHHKLVDVEVTSMSGNGRRVKRLTKVAVNEGYQLISIEI